MARYIQQVLQPGERLIHTATLHWILYAPGVLLLLLALALAIWATSLSSHGAKTAIDWFAVLVAIAGAVWAGWAWIQRFSTEIDVTDRRVVYKRGLIRRHTVETNMDKVASVDVDQSLFGRILDYGDVTVVGAGMSIETVSMVQSPLKLRNSVTAR